MTHHAVTRRTALTGGAVAAIGAITAGTAQAAAPARAAASLPAAGPSPASPGALAVSPKVAAARAAFAGPAAPAALVAPAALPAMVAGEQSYYVFSADLTASTSSSAGAGIVYVGSLAGSYPTGSPGWLGLTCQVPVGSLITGADVTVSGTRTGSEAAWCDYHQPDSAAGFVTTLTQKYFTSGSGVQTQSLAINKYYTGKEVYEIYLSSLTASVVARGIRVRYVPPAGGLVPMTPVRIYDSGTSPVGTAYRVVPVAGQAGIPANATAVVLNVEVYRPTVTSYVKVLPYQTDVTLVTQYVPANAILANLVVTKLKSGKIQLKMSAGSARIFVYALGYFLP